MLKSIISIIIAHIVGTGTVNTKVYEAPVKTPVETKIETTITVQPSPVTASPTKKETAIATTSVKKTIKKIANPSKVIPAKVSTSSSEQNSPTIVIPQVDFGNVNDKARVAIVNILCTAKGNELSPISGTGVVISPGGVILTNAHIGQYFLLKDFRGKDTVECKIRTGSPAYPTYNVELMYISPTWIKNNSTILKEQNPKGTGENDFALLRITGRIDGSPITTGFPFLIPDIREYILKQEPVLLISYPAGFLGGLSILQDLNVASSITNIQDYYTFKQDTIDVIDVGGTILSQKGSSGGAVIDSFVTLLGIITTSSEANSTDKRELRAITLAHINRTIQQELGFGLDYLLKQSPSEFSKTFASTTEPVLTKILTDVLNK